MPCRIPARCAPQQCFAPARSTRCSRPFSSTCTARALGPESPNYIEVPKPLQPTFVKKPHIKGILPTPRDVFKTRSMLPKESDEFIAQSTQEPLKPSIPGKYSKDAELRLYKQRLADSRKKALREGVKELHLRKTTTEAIEKANSDAFLADKHARKMAPPREVDVLTQTTISKNIRDFLEDKIPSTSRANISDARRKGYQARQAKLNAVREARLHDLYTQAREFIVDEEQLDDAIERAFGTDEEPMGWNNRGEPEAGADGKSVWAGPVPEGVAELLMKLKGGEGVGLAKERIKRVAEELTGGKM